MHSLAYSFLSEKFDIPPSRMRMLKLFAVLTGALHLSACFFWRVKVFVLMISNLCDQFIIKAALTKQSLLMLSSLQIGSSTEDEVGNFLDSKAVPVDVRSCLNFACVQSFQVSSTFLWDSLKLSCNLKLYFFVV